ncbi:hypothetical protein [Leucobacter sp. cx-169]|uniref:hypothetical protein n=1 Tax=Leucobacter sp. cx-169 TaxID=2770549 RepID=UPI00165E1C6F|nr:hypothetical protein [Leucobacter sp. cx-169]MBC9927266.1 hypothetical protein [Leucobacter sp. cx-169]
MATYAKTTEVSSDKSRREIETTLQRYGATHFGYMSEPGLARIAFQSGNRQVRFLLPLPNENDREFTHHSKGPRTASARETAYEQAVKQRWRALALIVKAKLEAVESGIAEFDQEFYAYTVLPNGRTVYEETGDQVATMIEARMPGRLMLESGE